MKSFRETIIESFESINNKFLIKEAKEIDLEDNDQTTKMVLPAIEMQKHEGKFSEASIEIVKFWLTRAIKLKKIRSQIAGLMQNHMVNDRCEFCKKNWGLRSECLENIEDLFEKFLKGNKYQNIYDISNWQSYFYKHAMLRTVCFSCSEEIIENLRNGQNKLNEQVKKYKNNESMIKVKKIIFDDDKVIKKQSPIIKFWLTLARNQISKRNNISN